MRVLIPMAGRGERFARENYPAPKPVLPIDGYPMVVKAAIDLPKGSEYTFVMLEEHITKHGIDATIKKFIPEAEFVVLDKVTEGQACTCIEALARNASEEDLIIGACDNGMIYDKASFEKLKEKADAIVFSFRNNVTVVEKPQQYGWIEVGADNKVVRMSVKKPISDDPIHDHAVVGAFWFKSESLFKEAVDRMITQNRRINNEFYVDEAINDIVQLGYNAYVLEVDKYICWGTPNDYKTYYYWKSFFEKSGI